MLTAHRVTSNSMRKKAFSPSSKAGLRRFILPSMTEDETTSRSTKSNATAVRFLKDGCTQRRIPTPGIARPLHPETSCACRLRARDDAASTALPGPKPASRAWQADVRLARIDWRRSRDRSRWNRSTRRVCRRWHSITRGQVLVRDVIRCGIVYCARCGRGVPACHRTRSCRAGRGRVIGRRRNSSIPGACSSTSASSCTPLCKQGSSVA